MATLLSNNPNRALLSARHGRGLMMALVGWESLGKGEGVSVQCNGGTQWDPQLEMGMRMEAGRGLGLGTGMGLGLGMAVGLGSVMEMEIGDGDRDGDRAGDWRWRRGWRWG